MTVVIAKIKVHPGKQVEFENTVKAVLSKVQEEAGTLVYRLNHSLQNPTTYCFYERYADQAAFTHHAGTPYLRAMFKAMNPLLDGAPDIEMFEEVAAIPDK